MNFRHDQYVDSDKTELIRRLNTNANDANSISKQFIPALIEALTQGQFYLAFEAFTKHDGYLEQDPICSEIAKQLNQLLQFFQSNASDPNVTNKPVLSSQDTINQM